MNGLRFCFVVTILAAGGRAAAAADVPARPNILWISAEDTTREYGCYGDRYALTPNIDRLATGGIRYANCFAEAPICAPSRFTLITGTHCGPLGTSPMRSQHRVPDAILGFPTYLRRAGYYTTNNVKTDYNTEAEPRFIRQSWDECSAKAHWRNRRPGQPFFAVFNYMDTHQSRDSQWPYEDFRRKVQSRLKPEQIHDPARAPLPPYYPDTPLARRTVARYYDCISTLDDFLQERLDELQRAGLADDTIVVFFADNGGGVPRAKATPLEIGVREPLIIAVPPKYRHLVALPPGTVVERLVCFADFAPTMLSLAGLEIPAYMQGRAFLGPRAAEPAKFVVGVRDRVDEVLEVTRWLNDGRFHYIRSYRTDMPLDQQTLTAFYNAGADTIPRKAGGGWQRIPEGGELVREIRRFKAEGKLNALQLQYWGDARPAEALYDGQNDPWGLTNLAGLPEYQERLRTMRGQLRQWMLSERDLGLWPEPEMAAAEQRGAPYEEARKPGVFPVERVLSTAELVGSGGGALPEFQTRLHDANSAVRYWSVVGLHALRAAARPALGDLRSAMKDPAASVRIEAAWAVAELEGSPDALALLAGELQNPQPWVAMRAARALELLGAKARPQLDAIRRALGQAPKFDYSFQMSLMSTLENLTGKTTP